MAQTELAQLQDKREDLRRELEKVDGQILEMKNKRKEELLAELEALGLDIPKITKAKTASTGDGKQRGRPKGFTMSAEQKEAMRLGRQKAKEAKQGKTEHQPTLQEA